MVCDVLYLAGGFNYGTSVSGNYILYKILQNSNVNFKVFGLEGLPTNNLPFNPNDFVKADFNNLPDHKLLLVSGDDVPPNVLKNICQRHNSKHAVITMTHWMYANRRHDSYPELKNTFNGSYMDERLSFYNDIKTYVITGSTYSTKIHLLSPLKHISYIQIPFPFEEIEVAEDFSKFKSDKKTILWGTTQPQTVRKGLHYFEDILNHLYEIVDNPNDILINTVGPNPNLNTKFNVHNLGRLNNRLELSKAYQASDVFALTTLADAGPMMATECIRNKTPLVSFDTNISLDLIGEHGKNGYIVTNINEYSQKLYEILYNNNYHMDLNYSKDFNSEEVVYKKFEQFFKTILK